MRESEATATDVSCAKAKRQQQMFLVRKRSDSNNNTRADTMSVIFGNATGRGVFRLSSPISAGVWTPAESSLNPHSSHHL
ncbi:hypothetical protein ACQKMI_22730 [Lysinibacillus sp. NPDC097214]|uniref:hypothetical protein n=1 Tax=Lysinibacillus sp. NPDC097214 TaxID=3390584 RepID=UPI003CFD8DFF